LNAILAPSVIGIPGFYQFVVSGTTAGSAGGIYAGALSAAFCRRHGLVAISKTATTLTVAVRDPFAPCPLDDLKRVEGRVHFLGPGDVHQVSRFALRPRESRPLTEW